jgi:hypothetical protein
VLSKITEENRYAFDQGCLDLPRFGGQFIVLVS